MSPWLNLPPADPDVVTAKPGDPAVYCHGRLSRAELRSGVWFCCRCGQRLPASWDGTLREQRSRPT